jgi:hypothetical protein
MVDDERGEQSRRLNLHIIFFAFSGERAKLRTKSKEVKWT